MTGVEILSTAEVVVEYSYSWTTFKIVLIAMCAIGGLIGVLLSFDSYRDWWEGLILGAVIGILVGILLGAMMTSLTGEPIAYETQYKVTINESVSMVEFLDKYEILDQEGKIYTVREKIK